MFTVCRLFVCVIAYQAADVGRAGDGAVVVDFIGVEAEVFATVVYASTYYLAGVVAYEAADVFRAGDLGSDFVDERRVGDVAGVLAYEATGVFAAGDRAAVFEL